MHQDLSMCHDWPVENAMVNLPVEMTGNSKLTFGNSQCKTQTADCRLRTGGKMQAECKMQTAD